MQSFHPKLIGSKTFEELFKDFFETARYDSVQMEVTRLELFSLFGEMSITEIQEYRRTYWPFYVYAIWSNPLDVRPEVMIKNIAIQLPDAVRLGFDILDKILSYANFRLTLEPDIQSFFAKTRDALERSDWPIGVLPNGKIYTIADCVKEVMMNESRASNSMEYAELYQKLSKLIFPNGLNDELYKKEYIYITTHEAVDNLIKIITVLTQNSPETLTQLVDQYAHPEIYDPDYGMNINIKTEPVMSSQDGKPSSPITPPANPMPPTPPLVKPAPAEIRAKIDAAFEKDAQGNYKDLDGVFIVLGRAAAKYNDPKIAELYYFDDNAGEFKWNV
ncbi:MAG: hypothetical protein WC457_04310 [Patescibacteria group bacterium]